MQRNGNLTRGVRFLVFAIAVWALFTASRAEAETQTWLCPICQTERIEREVGSPELTCPSCEHQWRILFDIASFLWAEIDRWSENMILTIHKLAGRYGWSETQILELSPVRRQMCMGLVNS